MSDSLSLDGYDEDRPKGAKRRPGKVIGWLALILPAVLAGVFSLIPNLFERLTAPEAALSYTLISSPSIRTPTGYSRILSLTIENSGSTRITGVEASLSFSGGVIDRISISDGGGDRPSITSAEDIGRMSVRSMFPKEKIAVTALATSGSTATRPLASVRSDQILGTPSKSRDEDELNKTGKWTAVAAAFGALTATLFGILTFKKDKESLSNFNFRMENMRFENVDPIVKKDEVIMFISDLVKSTSLTERLKSFDYKVMYVQFADLLAEEADRSRGNRRKRLIAGLKSLMLVPKLHEKTAFVIRDYLSKLGASVMDPGVAGDEIKDRAGFREAVRACFTSEGLRVPLSKNEKGFAKSLLARLVR